jgi:hypothetical protein
MFLININLLTFYTYEKMHIYKCLKGTEVSLTFYFTFPFSALLLVRLLRFRQFV